MKIRVGPAIKNCAPYSLSGVDFVIRYKSVQGLAGIFVASIRFEYPFLPSGETIENPDFWVVDLPAGIEVVERIELPDTPIVTDVRVIR